MSSEYKTRVWLIRINGIYCRASGKEYDGCYLVDHYVDHDIQDTAQDVLFSFLYECEAQPEECRIYNDYSFQCIKEINE